MAANAIYRSGVIYTNTTLQVPLELKQRVQAKGINMTQTFIKALERALEGEMPT
jgi:post-segregation antitoxin (ccd killing protein)